MTINTMPLKPNETAYHVRYLQLDGKLEKEDFPTAIEIYSKKIDFLEECLKEASSFDYQTLFEDKEKFVILRQMLQTCVNGQTDEVVFSKLQVSIDFIRTSS